MTWGASRIGAGVGGWGGGGGMAVEGWGVEIMQPALARTSKH